jgi:hypothetical protein
MEEYKQIFEAYQKINEAGFSYAGNYSDSTQQPKKQLARFKRPKNDLKNSLGFSTGSLPTGPQAKINIAAMSPGTGLPENEESDFKGIQKVPTNKVHDMYNNKMKEAHRLYKEGNYKQLESTLELMSMLARNLK